MGLTYKDGGRYWAKATRQVMSESSKGNPTFVLSFLIVGEINPVDPKGELISCPSYERSSFMTLTDKTIDFTIENLVAIGFDKPSFKFLDPNVNGFFNFTDLEFEVYCKHQEYQGKVSEKFQIASGPKEMNLKPLESSKMRSLDDLFGKQLKQATKGMKPKPEAVAAAVSQTVEEANGEIEDGEIPF